MKAITPLSQFVNHAQRTGPTLRVEDARAPDPSLRRAGQAATVAAFRVTAAPVAAELPDSCGTLALNHAGVKTPTNCW